MHQGLNKKTPGKSRQAWAWLGMPQHTQLKVAVSHVTLEDISMRKIKETDALLPKILMIKESCNLIG